jgi:methylated-DNA-protein-cysteine methyltransferase related protein
MAKPGGDGIFGQVHALVRRIPRGRVATYGQLSELIDGRLTPVGIGWAMRAATPDVPWHRVVNTRGGISTAFEVAEQQRGLLEAEGVPFDEHGLVDLSRARWKPRGKRERRL